MLKFDKAEYLLPMLASQQDVGSRLLLRAGVLMGL